MQESMRWPRPQITRSTLRRPAPIFEHFLALICGPDVLQCHRAVNPGGCGRLI
jgi:hypothetical protein